MLNSRISKAVKHIDDQIDAHDDDYREQDDGLDNCHVPRADGLHSQKLGIA